MELKNEETKKDISKLLWSESDEKISSNFGFFLFKGETYKFPLKKELKRICEYYSNGKNRNTRFHKFKLTNNVYIFNRTNISNENWNNIIDLGITEEENLKLSIIELKERRLDFEDKTFIGFYGINTLYLPNVI